jgi:hypothetical protein
VGRAETVVSPLAPGSGRFFDFYWPFPQSGFGGVSNAWQTRTNNINGGVGLYAMQPTQTGAGSSNQFRLQNSVPCAVFFPAAAPAQGFSFRSFEVGALKPILTKGHGIVPTCNDTAVYRVFGNLAFDGPPAADQDFGFELMFPANSNDQHIIRDNVPGIGWTLRANGDMALVVNGPLGLQFTRVATPGFDPTLFHTYEFVIFSATATAEAAVSAQVDSVPIARIPWGVGSPLPVYNAAYPQTLLSIVNYASAGRSLYCQRLRIMASGTLQGTF